MVKFPIKALILLILMLVFGWMSLVETMNPPGNPALLKLWHIITSCILGALFILLVLKNIQLSRRINPTHPITGFNTDIHELSLLVEKSLKSGAFSLVRADLDALAPINIQHGFAHGNTVLEMTAQLLRKIIKSQSPPNIYHLGSDNFYFLYPSDQLDVLEKYLQEFDEKIKEFYAQQEVEAGGIYIQQRRTQSEFHPIARLNMASTELTSERFSSFIEATHITSEVLKRARQGKTSNLAKDRRKPEFVGEDDIDDPSNELL